MSVRSGIPFTVTSGSDYNLDGISGNDRPNRIPALTLSTAHGTRAEQVAEWFNTAAFCDNNGGTNVACPSGVVGIGPNGQDGSSGRNSLRGPRFYQWDLGLFRDFHISERLALQA